MDLVQGKGVIDQKSLDISIFKPVTFSAIKKTKVPTQRKLKQGHFQEIPGLFSVPCSTGTSQQHLHLTKPCLKMCFRTPDSKKTTLKDSKAHINSFWSLLHGRKEARKTIFTQQLWSKRIITIVR